ncbi:MAG: GWxTD domain-containing protein, partial [Acidobacteriota bacterium]|jgi:GWxTD domain-containing protein
MAHRSGAIALLVFVVLPTTAAAVAQSQGSVPARAATAQPPPFEHWIESPVRYLVTEKEQAIGEEITDAAEFAAFRQWFWQRRDPLPETAINEFRESFEERASFANKEFGNPITGAPGWRTPRGVVYIVLGQPTRIRQSITQLAGTAGESLVKIWVYEFRGAPLLEVAFVKVDGAFTMLTTATNRPMQVRLEQSLRRAAQQSVHDIDLPFSVLAAPIGRPATADWPAHAVLRRSETGIDAELSIRLSELYGQPDGENLRVDLRFAATPPGGGPLINLGHLSVLLEPELFARCADRDLTLALWLPTSEELQADAELDVVEVASGRGIRLVPAPTPDEVSSAYDLEELVSYTRLWHSSGTVFAFVRSANGHDHPMHILRRLPDDIATDRDDPVPGFRFVLEVPQ